MEKLHYSIRINAPVHTVWSTMLGAETYREWTREFSEGSCYEGSWELGSEIRFLGPDEDGSPDGMIAKVVENRPHEFVSVEFLGQIVHGVDDTTSQAAKQLAGTHESYAFSESGGVTTVEAELDSEDDYVAMFDDAWPKALARLKELAEAS
jgi:hypothetical protein